LSQCRVFEVRIMIDIWLWANFETKATLGVKKLPGAFDSEIRRTPYIKIKRISEPGP
jgi:hypothetical protein